MLPSIIPLKPFYMIRHGESIANRDGYFSGNQDVALTDRGIAQAKEAQRIFDHLPTRPTLIIHSHLTRARDTARIINEPYDLPMVKNADFGEHGFGDWENQRWENVRELFYAGEDPPNGETNKDFLTRITRGFNNALSHPETVLIVCHGGVFRGFPMIYGARGKSVENSKFYYFTPNQNTPDFPWDITLVE